MFKCKWFVLVRVGVKISSAGAIISAIVLVSYCMWVSAIGCVERHRRILPVILRTVQMSCVSEPQDLVPGLTLAWKL